MSDVVRENKHLVSVQFNGVTDVLEFEPPSTEHKKQFKHHTGTERNEGQSWYGQGNRNGADVVNKALLGDPELFKYLERYTAELDKLTGYHTKSYTQVIQKVKRRRIKDYTGDELDIHKVYQGQLDTAWSKTERIEVGSKHHLVTLLIDLGGHAGQNAEASIWRAAIVNKLVRELEQAGKAVKIITGFAVEGAIKGSSKNLTATITIKDYNQALSLERLAAMSHLGFARAFCFGAFYCQEHPLYSSLGRPIDMIKTNVPIHIQQDIDAGHTRFVYIGRAMNSSSAMTHLKNAYKQMEEFAKDG